MRLSPMYLAALLSISTLTPHMRSQMGPLRAATPDDVVRATKHASADWKLVEPHLPDPATARPDALELQGDLLRARRFPEDALDFYGYAIKRGGDVATLLNKIGVTELELGYNDLARAFFERVVKMRRDDPQGWNNLGAVDFLDRRYQKATKSYKRAIKLDTKSAVSHSNLGLAYLEMKDYEMARKELALALELNPTIFEHTSTSGVAVHMLSTQDRAEFEVEMARVYARAGDQAEMLHALETAAEAGLDIRTEMRKDRDLAQYVEDPRVTELVRVAKSLREGRKAAVNVADALPPAADALSPAAGVVPVGR